MEPEERLTKRERQERARQERRQRSSQQVKEKEKRRWLTIVGVVAGVAGVAALLWFTREEPPETGIVVAAAAAESGAEAAGCEEVPMPPPLTTAHIGEQGAPPASDLYPVRPTHAGPHFGNISPVGVFDRPVDERLVVHNLEHGAVLVWYDPDLISGQDRRALESWAEERNRAGFHNRGGSAIVVSPYPDPLDSGKAIAFRAWLVPVDCDGFDQDFADAFLATHYGTRGVAPERAFGTYPEGVLEIEGDARFPGADLPGTDAPEGGMTDDVDEEHEDGEEPEEADDPEAPEDEAEDGEDDEADEGA